MTVSDTANTPKLLAGAWIENRGRPLPSATLYLDDLKKNFYRLTSAIGGMAPGYREGSEYLDELHYQRTLDKLTDQLHGVCADLGTLRASRPDHLRLKLAALLYLLPDDAGTELSLAASLLADFEEAPKGYPQR